MVKPTVTIRITAKSLDIFRKFFPAREGETIINYVDRLALWIEKMNDKDREDQGL